MKIREDKIVKKGIKDTYKKTKKLVFFSRAIFLLLIFFAREITTHYVTVIEPALIKLNLLDALQVDTAREIVGKGYYVVMILSYLPNIFATLKYDDKEQQAKSQLHSFHNVFTPVKQDKKGRVIYKVNKVREENLEQQAYLSILKEFGKIRKERLQDKTSFTPNEFKGFVKTLSKSNPHIKKYLEVHANNPDLKTIDSTDLYYKWKTKLDKYIV